MAIPGREPGGPTPETHQRPELEVPRQEVGEASAVREGWSKTHE